MNTILALLISYTDLQIIQRYYLAIQVILNQTKTSEQIAMQLYNLVKDDIPTQYHDRLLDELMILVRQHHQTIAQTYDEAIISSADNPFCRLPPEILQRIFSFLQYYRDLSNVGQVNRVFRHHVDDIKIRQWFPKLHQVQLPGNFYIVDLYGQVHEERFERYPNTRWVDLNYSSVFMPAFARISQAHFGNRKVTKLFLGRLRAFALTEAGNIYSWGQNAQGELGVGDVRSRDVPTPIPQCYFNNQKVINFNGGIALTEMGDLYVWGRHWKSYQNDRFPTLRSTPIILGNVLRFSNKQPN